MNNNFTAVARVGKLFGQADKGGVAVTLYTTFPDDFDPETENLFVDELLKKGDISGGHARALLGIMIPSKGSM